MALRPWLLVTMVLLAAGQPRPVFAQAILGAPSAAFLAPVDGSGPVNSPVLFAAPGAAPGTPPWGVVKADLEFLFLQPLFPGRAVTLNVPRPAGPSILGDTSNLSHDFSFSPGFDVGYQFKNTPFGAQVTGRMLHLTGSIDRTVHDSSGAVLAQASASSIVDLAVVNPLEGFVVVPLIEWCELEHPYLRESTFTFTFGGRYAHVQQNYTSNVVTAPNYQGTLVAKQTFDSFGLTGSVMGIYPFAERWAFYSNLRGSILIGDNNRESDVTIVTPDSTTALSASETVTSVVPTGEFELGIMCGTPLNRPGPSPNFAPLLWLKTGLCAQVWGDLGLLRINETGGHQFKDSSLWLVGFCVQIGLDY